MATANITLPCPARAVCKRLECHDPKDTQEKLVRGADRRNEFRATEWGKGRSCAGLLTAVGCAVDDHQQAPAPVSVYVPSEAVAAPAPLTPDPSPATGRGEQVALTPSPSPGNGRGEIVALTPGPSPDSGRGEIVVAYVSAEGGAIPEPLVCAPLPPTTRGAEESPARDGRADSVHPRPRMSRRRRPGGGLEVDSTQEGACINALE